ncbi:MAG: hypothetical protein NTZ59_00150 [Bacteroidetes bacterium]|nr:hypothetical protein [Bacteroidota bacterium]
MQGEVDGKENAFSVFVVGNKIILQRCLKVCFSPFLCDNSSNDFSSLLSSLNVDFLHTS